MSEADKQFKLINGLTKSIVDILVKILLKFLFLKVINYILYKLFLYHYTSNQRHLHLNTQNSIVYIPKKNSRYLIQPVPD